MSGHIYLIPTTLGQIPPLQVLPESVKTVVSRIDHFIVEREKTARHFIKTLCPEKVQSQLHFYLIDKHTPETAYKDYFKACLEGHNMGIISEAGVPAIADPGAKIVAIAHQRNIKVIPLVGPSSILMALMASGLNGQQFTFHGYLPIDQQQRKQRLRQLEKQSFEHKQAQLFIETPYRNQKMFEALTQYLSNDTMLCIALDITLPEECIQTKRIYQWKKEKPNLHKRPAIFIIEKQF